MEGIMTVDIGVLIGVVGCLLGLVGWMRNRDTDKTGNVRQLTTIEVKLDAVLSRIDKIETGYACITSDVQKITNRVSVIESIVMKGDQHV
jgi:hypothetical protein